MPGVSIQNQTRSALGGPRSVFSDIIKEVLPGWEISLTFLTPRKARALNMQLRKKSYVPNVLSYVVGNKSGEILICPSEAKKQAPSHGMDYRTFVLYLFIHGALHIKGQVHGATMERSERKLVARFATSPVRLTPNVTTNSNRHRYRHVPSKNGRGRRVAG